MIEVNAELGLVNDVAPRLGAEIEEGEFRGRTKPST